MSSYPGNQAAAQKGVSAWGFVSAACALLVLFGSLQPWATFVLVDFSGTDFEPGVGELVLAVVAAVIALAGAFNSLTGWKYYIPALSAGAVMAVIPVWFIIELASKSTQEFFGVSVTLLDPGSGVYICIVGAIAYLVSVGLQLLSSGGRASTAAPTRPAVTASQAAPSRPSTPAAPRRSGGRAAECGDCGARVTMNDTVCPSCGREFSPGV